MHYGNYIWTRINNSKLVSLVHFQMNLNPTTIRYVQSIFTPQAILPHNCYRIKNKTTRNKGCVFLIFSLIAALSPGLVES